MRVDEQLPSRLCNTEVERKVRHGRGTKEVAEDSVSS